MPCAPCEWSLRKLVRERCYNAVSLILSGRAAGARGKYRESAADLGFEQFAKAMCGHVRANYQAIKNAPD